MAMHVSELKHLIAERLGTAPNVAAVYLFGSRARGVARPDSDVDLGILYQVTPRATLLEQPFELQTQLSSALGKPVDVVVMNTAPVDLVHRILRDGELLLEPDKSRRIAFEVQARNAYFDLLPVLQRYRRKSA
jgi:predicted nucleotidyltransferase